MIVDGMKLVTRAEARAAGLDRFFTSKPCGRGHVAERYVSNNSCLACVTERGSQRQSEICEKHPGSTRFAGGRCKVCVTQYQSERAEKLQREGYIEVVEKTCSVCNETKPQSDFSTARRNKDGLAGQCKACRVKYDMGRAEKLQREGYIEVAEKICGSCNETKPRSDFSTDRKQKDGVNINEKRREAQLAVEHTAYADGIERVGRQMVRESQREQLQAELIASVAATPAARMVEALDAVGPALTHALATRNVVAQLTTGLVNIIESDLATHAARGGHKEDSVMLLAMLVRALPSWTPPVAGAMPVTGEQILAAIAARTTLDLILAGRKDREGKPVTISRQRAARAIGEAVAAQIPAFAMREGQAGTEIRFLSEADAAALAKMKTRARRAHIEALRAARALARRLKAPVPIDGEWRTWDLHAKMRAGAYLLDGLCAVRVEGEPVLSMETNLVRLADGADDERGRGEVVVLAPATREWLLRKTVERAGLAPVRRPMLCRPDDWIAAGVAVEVDEGGVAVEVDEEDRGDGSPDIGGQTPTPCQLGGAISPTTKRHFTLKRGLNVGEAQLLSGHAEAANALQAAEWSANVPVLYTAVSALSPKLPVFEEPHDAVAHGLERVERIRARASRTWEKAQDRAGLALTKRLDACADYKGAKWDHAVGVARRQYDRMLKTPLDMRNAAFDRADALEIDARNPSPRFLELRRNEAIADYSRACDKIIVEAGLHWRHVDTALALQRTWEHHGLPGRAGFHFGHQVDWRGRLYPSAESLTPHGNDLARGLLQFAKGKPLGATGRRWLAIHVANTMKVGGTFDERVAWVEEHEAAIIEAASERRPMAGVKKKQRWQNLAAVIEWARLREFEKAGFEAEDFASALPVPLDATSSGFQWYALLTGNSDEAEQVGLGATRDGKKPVGLYDATASEAGVPRAYAKADLVTRQYGSSGRTRRRDIREEFHEEEGRYPAPEELSTIVGAVEAAAEERIGATLGLMGALQDIARYHTVAAHSERLAGDLLGVQRERGPNAMAAAFVAAGGQPPEAAGAVLPNEVCTRVAQKLLLALERGRQKVIVEAEMALRDKEIVALTKMLREEMPGSPREDCATLIRRAHAALRDAKWSITPAVREKVARAVAVVVPKAVVYSIAGALIEAGYKDSPKLLPLMIARVSALLPGLTVEQYKAIIRSHAKAGMVEWVSPTGMLVRHAPTRHDAIDVISYMPPHGGRRRDIHVASEKIRVPEDSKLVTGLAADFIHSLDGALVAKVAVKLAARGIHIGAVHDSFIAHAADVEEMRNVLRETMVELAPVARLMLARLASRAGVELPAVGDFNVAEIASAEYAFE